jgi:hypothetical protein
MGPSPRATVRRLVAFLGLAILAGCAREAPDKHDARIVANRYLAALARKDITAIAKCATCVVAMSTVRGGQVLRIDDPQAVTVGALDSLTLAVARAQKSADSLWQMTEDAQADSLYAARRRLTYSQSVYRNAVRAVRLSHPDTLFASSSAMETRALRVRVRYGGPLVGPKPIDREEILRMLRAPGGRWIVFSMYLTEDDPFPDGV